MPRLHPNLAGLYRQKVMNLAEALNEEYNGGPGSCPTLEPKQQLRPRCGRKSPLDAQSEILAARALEPQPLGYHADHKPRRRQTCAELTGHEWYDLRDRDHPRKLGGEERDMKLPPLNIKIERETVERDLAARWLAEHDPDKRPQRRRRKAGARR